MWGRLKYFGLLVGLLVGFYPSNSAALTPCVGVNILELQVRGVADLNGDQAFVNVANSNATSATVKIQYFRADGVQVDGYTSPSFTIPAMSTKVVVAAGLSGSNPGQSSLGPMIMNPDGGALRLVKTTTGEPVCDTVGWGDESLMFETSPTLKPLPGQTLSRIQLANGSFQDTNNNLVDFEVYQPDCVAADILEVQPFVVDSSGQDIDAWIELSGKSSKRGDCSLITSNGDSYIIPGADLPLIGEVTVINRGLNASNTPVSLHLGESTGQLWLTGLSRYGGVSAVRLPVMSVAYSSLLRGQSWALVDAIWRRTYQPTPGEANIYQVAASLGSDDPTACDAIRVTELLPNPSGEDTSNEWLEIHNTTHDIVALAHCQVSINGVAYSFLSDDVLAADEWRASGDFYDSDGLPKTINLRNSDDNSVILQRLRADGALETVQSFVYSNAPEGQSWARFDDGWRWVSNLTPNENNTTPPAPNTSDLPTEFPAPSAGSGSGESNGPGKQIDITEILPNPAAPATDDNDEFVELYNPNSETVDLTGYKIQTGESFSYSYTISDLQIGVGEYAVITSGVSSLSLSNTSGRARLLDPAGNVLSQTDGYTAAPEGQSWAKINGVWGWTSAPTPRAANVYLPPLLKVATTVKKSSTSSTAKAPTKAKSATTATKAAKTAKPGATTGKTAAAAGSSPAGITPLHPLVLAGVGSVALLYAGYEYRSDIANRIYKFRSNRADRRAARTSSKGR